jgi:hypothetical protein
VDVGDVGAHQSATHGTGPEALYVGSEPAHHSGGRWVLLLLLALPVPSREQVFGDIGMPPRRCIVHLLFVTTLWRGTSAQQADGMSSGTGSPVPIHKRLCHSDPHAWHIVVTLACLQK